MKHLLKGAMLVCVVTLLLSALSLTTAEAKANSSGSPTFRHLNSVAAVSASDVWAVGSFSKSNNSFQTLIEHWNGIKWSVVSNPNPGSISNGLDGIGAVSASDIWAVGISSNTSNSFQTLIEHWNGSTWSIVKSPSPGSGVVSLSDVAVVSTNNVWAAGSSNTSSTTLIEHWNGTGWSVVKSPNPGSVDLLLGIAVVSTNNIWAVGQSLAQIGQGLIEHWNGSTWSVVKSPNQLGSVNSF